MLPRIALCVRGVYTQLNIFITAWHGGAWRGEARLGRAWRGKVSFLLGLDFGSWLGTAGHGGVGHGMARHGMARQGKARVLLGLSF